MHIRNNKDFEECIKYQGGWFYADADCGGIALIAWPKFCLKSDYYDIMQLLADLESLSWNKRLSDSANPSIDVGLIFVKNTSGYGGFQYLPPEVGRDADEGDFYDDVWIANEFWSFRKNDSSALPKQIHDVLKSSQNRINLS